MKKLYFVLPAVGVLAFAALYNWQLTPNPWIVRDETAGRSNVCPLHHVQMVTLRVRIRYPGPLGWRWKLLREDSEKRSEAIEAEKAKFPFARTEAYGTDAYSNQGPGVAYIYVCPACTKSVAEWEATRQVP